MQTTNTFTVIFFTRKSRNNSQKLTIYARITVSGKRTEISLKRSISVCNWDSSKGRARGTSQNIRILNNYLDHVYGQLLDCHKQLLEEFKLSLNDKVTSKDTVVFSFIGFKTERYLVSELYNSNTISLHPENTKLDEVVLSSKKFKLKPKKIGRASKGLGLMHYNFYTYNEKDVDERLSKELGMKFNVRRDCHIKDLNFNITGNDFKSLKFRVNIYNVKNGLPKDLIVQENIIFEIKDNFLGWFKVDLEPYEINFKEGVGEVAVTIQWLESIKENEKSKYLSISTASSPTHTAYFKEKAMDSWNKGGQSLSFYLNAICE